MDKTKRKIKIILIGLILIVIACFGVIYNLNNMQKRNISENVSGDGDSKIEYENEKVRDATQFFSVEKCIQNNIDKNFSAKDMNLLYDDYVISFAIYGQILDSNTNSTKDAYYILRLDTENDTFKIENLEEKQYSNINQIDLKTDINKIENNGSNKMEYTTVTDEQLSRIYYEQFSKLEIENPEKAYEILDEKYREERFPTIEDFKEYINNYKDIIKTGAIAKYSRDIQNDYTECVLVDNYNNYYTLKETSIMNYTIMLDNYTIKTSDYEEKYQELDDKDKVQANAYIFLQMINTKDYKHAYDILDPNFKQNNFSTLEKFMQYVKDNFFDYNINSPLSSEKSIEEQGEYYIYKTVVRNNSGSAAESKQITIIMKILDGTDFVMSFSI